MAYITKAELKGRIPDEWLDGAMDDANTGAAAEGVWEQVAADVDEEINGRIGGRYATPLSPVPDIVKAAAKVIACYFLFKRYGAGDARNPWTKQLENWQARLDRIGRGEEPLSYGQSAASPAGALISEPSKIHSASGGLMV